MKHNHRRRKTRAAETKPSEHAPLSSSSRIISASDQRIHSEAAQKPCTGQQSAADQLSRHIKFSEWWMIGLTSLLVVGAGLQWHAMEGQILVAQKATTASTELFHIDQRAWVSIKSINVGEIKPGQRISVILNLFNSGKTVATNLLHPGITVIVNETDYDPDKIIKTVVDNGKWPSYGPTTVTLFPGNETRVLLDGDKPVTEELADGIKSGKLHLYLVGTITYDDSFGGHHFTNFFGEYYPSVNNFGALAKHNDAN